ncbi:MAG: CoA pyrophosphatase [Elusimicrobiota bacterium]
MRPDHVRARLAQYRPRGLTVPGAGEAAVSLILSPLRGGGCEALFIRRAVDPKDPWSGQIGLPGGRREDCDNDLLATALRETLEEIGLSLTREQVLGRLDDTQPKGRGLPPIVFQPFVFEIDGRAATRLSAEVADVFWLPLERIAASRKDATVEEKGRRLTVPAYCVKDYVIWGATQRVLARLFEILR